MKAIFIHFYGFSFHSGISKKILSQIKALHSCNVETELCYIEIDDEGSQKRVCNGEVIDDFGKGFSAKYAKWIKFKNLTGYILNNSFDFCYVRSSYNSNFQLIKMLGELKKAGITNIMEIPTYPYDNEIKGVVLKYLPIFLLDRIFRNRLNGVIDRIVTFSDYPEILGIKTIRISNAVEFDLINVKESNIVRNNIFNLIAVAEIHFWHGFDRIICGLGRYFKDKNRKMDIILHLVGDGPSKDMKHLRDLVSEYKLEERVIFYGNQQGSQLDDLFEIANFGIASLGRHRSGVSKIKTLKNREYAARGIPFIYSEFDDDFDNMPYILRMPQDDSPIDVYSILDFYNRVDKNPVNIRESIINKLSWEIQMRKVVDEIALIR